MPIPGPHISHAWRSTFIAICIGLAAPLIVIGAPYVEAVARHIPLSDATQATASQALYDRPDTVIYDELFQLRGPHRKPGWVQSKTGSNSEYYDNSPSIPEVVVVGI